MGHGALVRLLTFRQTITMSAFGLRQLQRALYFQEPALQTSTYLVR